MTCQRAEEFLSHKNVKIKVQVDAKKERIGAAAAVKLARSVEKLWVAKGKKVVFFDLKQDKPSDAELQKVLLGPSGNLRAHNSKRKRTLRRISSRGIRSEAREVGRNFTKDNKIL